MSQETLKSEDHSFILIVDYGGQTVQLIARKIREIGVYCKIESPEQVTEKSLINCKGIILSGSPHSVTDPNAPGIPPAILDMMNKATDIPMRRTLSEPKAKEILPENAEEIHEFVHTWPIENGIHVQNEKCKCRIIINQDMEIKLYTQDTLETDSSKSENLAQAIHDIAKKTSRNILDPMNAYFDLPRKKVIRRLEALIRENLQKQLENLSN